MEKFEEFRARIWEQKWMNTDAKKIGWINVHEFMITEKNFRQTV